MVIHDGVAVNLRKHAPLSVRAHMTARHRHPPSYMRAARPAHKMWMVGQAAEHAHVGQSNASVSWHGVMGPDLVLIERLLYGCKGSTLNMQPAPLALAPALAAT